MKLMLVTLTGAIGLLAQTPTTTVATVSISPQGRDAIKLILGKRVSGLALLSVDVCNASGGEMVLNSSRVYQAVQAAGVRTISPITAAMVIARAQKKHPLRYFLDFAGIAGAGAGILTAADVIKASKSWQYGLLIGPQFLNLLIRPAQEHLPDYLSFQQSLLNGPIQMGRKSCQGGLILANEDRKLLMAPISADIRE